MHPIDFQPRLPYHIVSFDVLFQAMALMLDVHYLPVENPSSLL